MNGYVREPAHKILENLTTGLHGLERADSSTPLGEGLFPDHVWLFLQERNVMAT